MSTAITKGKSLFKLALCCLFLLPLAPALAAAPGDVVYERKTEDDAGKEAELASFPPATFPHWIHRINYRCDACHDTLFEMKRGGTPVTMDLMKEGKVCGVCHNGDLAFGSSFQTCNRCHLPATQE